MATIGALLAAIALVLILLFGSGGDERTYRLLFETGGQLVPGNEVLAGGHRVGSVDDVRLTDDYQAEVKITVDQPLHEGTTAVIRSTSLSGIANRYVSLTQGPSDAPELPDNSVVTQTDTTAPVDLDQLFDTFPPRTRRALRDVIQGSADLYAGRSEQANKTYKFLNPGLVSTTRLLEELARDQQVLTDWLVDGSRVVTALAERRDDLSELTSNANAALGAIARENDAFDRSLRALPPALRQANTTFVNLRAALDDLDPLVATSKTATRDLAPFLRKLRPVATKAVPVFRDLRLVVLRKGRANDLTDTLEDLPGVHSRASSAVPEAIDALDDSQPVLDFARPYMPDLLGFVSRFGQATAYYDAAGHYARVMPLTNVFSYNAATEQLDPTFNQPELQYSFYDTTPGAEGIFTRCPGGASQPAADGSSPFTDDGRLLAGGQPPNPKCDPADGPPGP